MVFYSPEGNIMEILGYMDVALENTRGNVDCNAGLCISQDQSTCHLFLDQHHYFLCILAKYGFIEFLPSSILADPHVRLSLHTAIDEPTDFTLSYKAITGSLRFVSVGALGQIFLTQWVLLLISTMLPGSLFIAMRSRNFWNTLALLFIGTSAPNVHTVHANADYAMDLEDQRSKIDFVLFLNNTRVAW